jgi:hypothetical protein
MKDEKKVVRIDDLTNVTLEYGDQEKLTLDKDQLVAFQKELNEDNCRAKHSARKCYCTQFDPEQGATFSVTGDVFKRIRRVVHMSQDGLNMLAEIANELLKRSSSRKCMQRIIMHDLMVLIDEPYMERWRKLALAQNKTVLDFTVQQQQLCSGINTEKHLFRIHYDARDFVHMLRLVCKQSDLGFAEPKYKPTFLPRIADAVEKLQGE